MEELNKMTYNQHDKEHFLELISYYEKELKELMIQEAFDYVEQNYYETEEEKADDLKEETWEAQRIWINLCKIARYGFGIIGFDFSGQRYYERKVEEYGEKLEALYGREYAEKMEELYGDED